MKHLVPVRGVNPFDPVMRTLCHDRGSDPARDAWPEVFFEKRLATGTELGRVR